MQTMEHQLKVFVMTASSSSLSINKLELINIIFFKNFCYLRVLLMCRSTRVIVTLCDAIDIFQYFVDSFLYGRVLFGLLQADLCHLLFVGTGYGFDSRL